MVKKILIMGHSYITRLKSYIREDPEQCTFTLNLDPQEVMIQYAGGGGDVASMRGKPMEVVQDFQPDIVLLQIGTNELYCNIHTPSSVSSAIVNLVDTLHHIYNVQFVAVLQILHIEYRQNAEFGILWIQYGLTTAWMRQT